VIENPTNEALTYEWTLYTTTNAERILYGATTPIFELTNFGNSTFMTVPCRVTLKVNAPDPARSKGPTTVWSGQCSYHATRLN
jgi:hypothetical protein